MQTGSTAQKPQPSHVVARSPHPASSTAANLLLFDVDATLLKTGGAGMRAMIQAGKDILGPRMSWDGIEASGGLDPILFAEAARRSSLDFRPEDHEAFKRRYAELLEPALKSAAGAGGGLQLLPGVPEVLAEARSRSTITLGLLTGNYAETALIKLRAVGLDEAWFPLKVFGDEAGSRPGLVALALQKYERLHGQPIPPRRVVMIGDTPRDVEAALSNGCLALGVATGKYPIERLVEAGAHAAIQSLRDPSRLWALLDGADGALR